MKVRLTDDPGVVYAYDALAYFALGIAEYRVDLRGGRFKLTPIYIDGSTGPEDDATHLLNKCDRSRN